MGAYVQPELYKELKSIEKEQINQKFFNKWNEYNIRINEEIILFI